MTPPRCILVLLLAAAPALAEDVTLRGYAPVEMLYEDLDPLARGLRQLNVGLGPQGQDTVVFERADAKDKRFYVFSPGITVSYDRSQYYYFYHARSKTEYVWLKVPPNTVFHIGTPPVEWRDRSLGVSPYRWDAGIDARVHAAAAPSPGESNDPGVDPTLWPAYYRSLDANRRDVLAALDRTLGE